MKSAAFYFSPKVHYAFGLLLLETMSEELEKIAQSGHTAHKFQLFWKLLRLHFRQKVKQDGIYEFACASVSVCVKERGKER